MSITSKYPAFVLLSALVLGLLVGVGPAVAGPGAKPGKPAEEAAIGALLQAQVEAWNRGDAAAWSKVFVPDADFVNIVGMVFSGRKEIEERHAAIFATMFKGTRTAVTVRRVVFLSPRLAIVDSEHVVTGFEKLPPTMHPVDGALRTRMKYVLRKGAQGWQVVAGQNTEIKPVPARPTP